MNEKTLLDRAMAALTALGLDVRVTEPPQKKAQLHADAWLRIGKGKGQVDYVVEAKRTLTPETLGAATMQLRHIANTAGRAALLVTDYLTPPMAASLRDQQQQFADAAGNAYLEGPGLMVYVTGRKLQDTRIAPNSGKAYTLTGLKVTFALLCDPELANAPQRAIAAAAGVALGAIPAVLADLRQTGHLLVLAVGPMVLCPGCDATGEAYRFENRPTVLRCRHCQRSTSLTAGTVMHATRTPLQVWFWAA